MEFLASLAIKSLIGVSICGTVSVGTIYKCKREWLGFESLKNQEGNSGAHNDVVEGGSGKDKDSESSDQIETTGVSKQGTLKSQDNNQEVLQHVEQEEIKKVVDVVDTTKNTLEVKSPSVNENQNSDPQKLLKNNDPAIGVDENGDTSGTGSSVNGETTPLVVPVAKDKDKDVSNSSKVEKSSATAVDNDSVSSELNTPSSGDIPPRGVSSDKPTE